MFLIDTHAHVNFKAFADDAEEVLQTALNQRIGVVLVSSHQDTSTRSVELAEKFADGEVWAAIGLHPDHVVAGQTESATFKKSDGNVVEYTFKTRAETFDPDFYRQLARSDKVKAVGECGLDLFHTEDEVVALKQQEPILMQQIALAKELGLPLVLHSRAKGLTATVKLNQRLLDMLGEQNYDKAVLHCYAGDYAAAKRIVSSGVKISFTGIATYPARGKHKEATAELHRCVRELPLDSFMLETDSPYLAPTPVRGQRNEPQYVRHVVASVAELRDIHLEEVAQVTTETAKVFFS